MEELFNKLNSKFTAYNWNKHSPKSNNETTEKIKDEIMAILKGCQLEPPVSQATCGFCKDCKFWDAENAECTNDVIFINKDVATGYISDFKTQNFFGCIKFESKLSG